MFSLPRLRVAPTHLRALHTTRPASMPLYIAYCPDYADSLERRKSVREAHLADAGKDKETGASGECVLGRH